MMPFDRESASADALLTDLYLDALLAGAVLEAAAATSDGPIGLDPAARLAADRLRRDLVRVHPSFRFEERLATRLAEAAVALQVPLAAGAEGGRVVPFPAVRGSGPDPTDIDGDASIAGVGPRDRSRPLLIGGALTSAAISIAGAAFVAWRFGRPNRATTPMARAARAVREARLAAAGGARHALDPDALRRRLD
jgi:hypothetical protein